MTPADNKASAARAAVKEASSGELAVRTEPNLRDLVALNEGEIAKALPNAIEAARYVRIVQTEIRKNPKLLECSPQSFLGAVLTAAQLGLEFGPLQQAYMVPFKKRFKDSEGNWQSISEIQLIVGYKGWLSLINRSAEIQSVSAHAVYERDDFDYSFGMDETLTHKPAKGDRGAVIAYYCVIRKTNGGRSFAVMTMDEMLAHRERYAKKFDGKFTGPWLENFEEMALKTVFLRAKTWVPVSAEAQLTQQALQDVDSHVIKRSTVDEEPVIEPFDDDILDAEIVSPHDGTDEETAWDREEREAREAAEGS